MNREQRQRVKFWRSLQLEEFHRNNVPPGCDPGLLAGVAALEDACDNRGILLLELGESRSGHWLVQIGNPAVQDQVVALATPSLEALVESGLLSGLAHEWWCGQSAEDWSMVISTMREMRAGERGLN